jgi:hypothetical protein
MFSAQINFPLSGELGRILDCFLVFLLPISIASLIMGTIAFFYHQRNEP